MRPELEWADRARKSQIGSRKSDARIVIGNLELVASYRLGPLSCAADFANLILIRSQLEFRNSSERMEVGLETLQLSATSQRPLRPFN